MAMLQEAGAIAHESTARGEYVHVLGDIDRNNAAEFEELLRSVLALGRDITVDLTHCRYIGSLGVSVMLRARQQAPRAFITLVDPASSAARLLQTAKVQMLLGVRYQVQMQTRDMYARQSGRHAHVITLEGEWDLSRGNELHERLEAAAAHPRIVVDMSNVTYMDQFCVGMLLRARTQRVAKGYPPAYLVLASANIRRVLGVADFHELFMVRETLEEALESAQ